MAANYKQGDAVWLSFPIPLPDNKELDHPVLIISSNRANGYEKCYTGIMLTHHLIQSPYSFELTDLMFESPLTRSAEKPKCFARTYITVFFTDSQIRSFLNRMKPAFFKTLLNQIKETVLNID